MVKPLNWNNFPISSAEIPPCPEENKFGDHITGGAKLVLEDTQFKFFDIEKCQLSSLP